MVNGTGTDRTSIDKPKRKKCSACNKIGDYIACHKCTKAFCFPCADISIHESNLLKKDRIKYECVQCCNKKDTTDNFSVLVEMINQLKTQLSSLQQNFEKICNERTDETDCSQNPQDMDSMISEMEERRLRAKNVIMYDIPESDNDNKDVRINHDTSEVTNIVQSMNVNINRFSKVRRLGKKTQGSNPRPIMVTLENAASAISILKKARANKISFIKNDLTPIQREKLKQLKEKLKTKLEGGETDWTIKYVRGIPQLWKIHREQNE
uniref:Uncharacterized protein n=1 Tax=Cacopsylla melanoneura TaxID=428564 RepID=A0A8D8U590_9HEMI